jgi:aryl-alcohol dehydrogenase-like predicted oxidoreductase
MIELEQISKIGFGGYRISVDASEHEAALRLALESGCNLIDTSTNYLNGKSELLIGEVLKRNRNLEACVVTKAGYIQNDNLRVLSELNSRGLAKDDLVVVRPDLMHSIHPDFLRDQIDRSLVRLQLKVIDVFLLHNPEYYFKQEGDVNDDEYYRRIRNAFEFLEEMVVAKKIRYYGISSNTLPLAPTIAGYTDLAKLIQLAEQVSSSGHFKFIQFPHNLAERGALERRANGMSLLDLARKHGIKTMANRPLNIQHGQTVIRIAEYSSGVPEAQFENTFTELLDLLRLDFHSLGVDFDPMEVEIVQHLSKTWKAIGNHEAVHEIYTRHLQPFMATVYEGAIPDQAQASYLKLLSASLHYTSRLMKQNTQDFIDEMISQGRLSRKNNQPLPLTVCQQYLQDGLDHVLVGMRKPAYVQQLQPLFFR